MQRTVDMWEGGRDVWARVRLFRGIYVCEGVHVGKIVCVAGGGEISQMLMGSQTTERLHAVKQS